MDIYCTKDVLSTRGWLPAVPKPGESNVAVMEGSCWHCCCSASLNAPRPSDQCFPKGTIDHLLCLFILSRQVSGTCGSGICGLGAARARQYPGAHLTPKGSLCPGQVLASPAGSACSPGSTAGMLHVHKLPCDWSWGLWTGWLVHCSRPGDDSAATSPLQVPQLGL